MKAKTIEGREVNMNTEFSFPTDNQWIVTDPQGRTGVVTSYNQEVTGVPECLVGVFGYSDSWSYWEHELRRRGWKVERLDGTNLGA